jgi:hypothetical protein
LGIFHGVDRGRLVDRIVERFAGLSGPVLVRVAGPAGGGRSRLVEEVYERLVERQEQPYWPSLGVADRLPNSARDLQASRRLELAPEQVRGIAGLLPQHLWLALHGATVSSLFAGREDERSDLLDELEQQMTAHLGPLLLSIESRFTLSDAKRIGRFVLNFVPVLSAFAPLLETGDLRDVARKLAPSRTNRASRAAIAEADAVTVSEGVQPDARAESLAKAIVTLAGERGFPTLLAVDDADLVGPETVQVITRLLQSSSRVMVLATTRLEPRDGLSAPSPFDTMLEDLAERRPARLWDTTLPDLTREEMRAMVEERFPGTYGKPVSQVLDAAGENPLVLQSLLIAPGVQQALIERRDIPDRLVGSLPRSVEEVFGVIWTALSDEVREAFAIASLQGNPFDPGWVRTLPGRVPDGLLRGERDHGLIAYEEIGREFLGWFRRSWVQLRARDSLVTEYGGSALEVAVDAYLRYVEARLADDTISAAPHRVLRALLGAYIALGVGDGIIPGRHRTTELGRAAVLLATTEEQFGRVDVARSVLARVLASGDADDAASTVEWVLLEARLERRTGRTSAALAALDRLSSVPPEHELEHLIERTRCEREARIELDIPEIIARVERALALPFEDGGPGADARLGACRMVADLIIDADADEALRMVEQLTAGQEPQLDRPRALHLRSTLAGANARAGRFHRAREIWLAIEDELPSLDSWVERKPDFRGSYASWLPVVGAFQVGVAIMREHWEQAAEALSDEYPTALTARQGLIYWLVEGGEMDAAAAASEYGMIAERLRMTMEPSHRILRNVRINEALMLVKSGRFSEAIRAIEVLRAEHPDNEPPHISGGRLDRYEAIAREGLGDFAGALQLSRRDHEARVEALGATAWRSQEALCVRARLESPDVALELIGTALAGADPIERALNPAVMQLHGERARILGDVEGLRRVLERQEELLGERHEDAVRSRRTLEALTASGDLSP